MHFAPPHSYLDEHGVAITRHYLWQKELDGATRYLAFDAIFGVDVRFSLASLGHFWRNRGATTSLFVRLSSLRGYAAALAPPLHYHLAPALVAERNKAGKRKR